MAWFRRPSLVLMAPDASPEASAGPDGVWGCPECGALFDRLPADNRCESCADGWLVRLGGDPSVDKARALIAWARRDTTQVLESRGAIVGALAAACVGLLVAGLASLGMGALFVVLYLAVLGALAGHLLALRVHRRLRPHSRLQPIVDVQQAGRVRLALIAWTALPWLVGTLLFVFGPHSSLAQTVRTAAGRLLAVLSG